MGGKRLKDLSREQQYVLLVVKSMTLIAALLWADLTDQKDHLRFVCCEQIGCPMPPPTWR